MRRISSVDQRQTSDSTNDGSILISVHCRRLWLWPWSACTHRSCVPRTTSSFVFAVVCIFRNNVARMRVIIEYRSVITSNTPKVIQKAVYRSVSSVMSILNPRYVPDQSTSRSVSPRNLDLCTQKRLRKENPSCHR